MTALAWSIARTVFVLGIGIGILIGGFLVWLTK